MPFRIAHISDTHLSRDRPFFQHNWEVLLEILNGDPPDLVVCTGDISIDGAGREQDLVYAAAQLNRLAMPVLTVPGNHDCGNSLPDVRGGEPTITGERVRTFRHHFGPDYWLKDIEHWRLVGLNSMLMGSGLPEESEQQSWLEDALSTAAPRRPIVFMHKPLFLNDPADDILSQSAMYPEHRKALISLFVRHNVFAVATGHQHDYRRQSVAGIRLIWAPSTAFVMDSFARLRPRYGTRRVGYVEHVLTGRRMASRLVEPHLFINIDIGNWMRDSGGFHERYAVEPLRGLRLADGQ